MTKPTFIDQGNTILADILKRHQQGADAPLYCADDALVAQLGQPGAIPAQGLPLENVVNEALAGLTQGYCNVQHPGFFGYISPKPDLSSILGDLLAAGHNQTSGAWRAGPFATVVERQVLAWLCQLTGFVEQSGNIPNGIITNGGALANATALKLARERTLGKNVKDQGLYGHPTLRFYGSTESHFSIHRSLDFLGMGKDNLVSLPANARGQLDVSLLEQQIQRDIDQGYLPCAVVAVAGTTATGQVDPLNDIHPICQKYGLWLHVDGAAGAVFAQLPETAGLFAGIDKADSLCIDPCKWLFQSFGIGCLLVQNGHTLLESFSIGSHYWADEAEPDFFQMGLTGTRQWRSLGLWFSFKTWGRAGIEQQLRHIRDCAKAMQTSLSALPFVEVHPHCELAVAVFRLQCRDPALNNQSNRALQQWLIRQNSFFLSELEINGDIWLRAAVSNTATKIADIQRLADTIGAFYQSLTAPPIAPVAGKIKEEI